MALLLKEAPKLFRINCLQLFKKQRELMRGSRTWELVPVRLVHDNYKRDKVTDEGKKHFRPFTLFPRFLYSTSVRSVLDAQDIFETRHIGSGKEADIQGMLQALKLNSLDELIQETVPAKIRSKTGLGIGSGLTESEALKYIRKLSQRNELYQNHIGMGYYGTLVPAVIQRNILENPAWYTQYTPYQAEVSQGRLESLLNYQTMVSDLTALPIAGASLLDEATAAAEAMAMCYALSKQKKKIFIVSDSCHPQTIQVIRTRAEGFGMEVVVGKVQSFNWKEMEGRVCGILLQYPTTYGIIEDYEKVIAEAHHSGAKVIMSCDLLSLTMLKPPGEMNADFAVGSSQRLGVPMGYGGPHAAFFATKDEYKRLMPGRIIGVSKDSQGKLAFRMAMQTREQHIRRDKATSNICTAQALLANMSAMYGIYHGPDGLKKIASRIHDIARVFQRAIQDMGYETSSPESFFDTVRISFHSKDELQSVLKRLKESKINVRVVDEKSICVAFDETHTKTELESLVQSFAVGRDPTLDFQKIVDSLPVPSTIQVRTSNFMTHPIFHSYRSEHELLRYMYRLQSKDVSLVHSMIPLGSCTMKLNATSEMIPISWPEFALPHPFAPKEQMKGYWQMFEELSEALVKITKLNKVSLQPNSGAQGEYTGLMVIREYHKSRKEGHRNVCIIPVSAHGTNPASAAMCGMRIVVVGCDEHGNINLKELEDKAEQYKDELAALMVTYPSTHGVFEDGILDVVEIIHSRGGQVYMDGANMNAQVGICSPGDIGADVCHLNLHKTFCIPHGGGGPGMGPIAVASHLAPFLPSHPIVPPIHVDPNHSLGAVAAAPFGSSSILPISYMYIKMMGDEGLTKATKVAILNANYMAQRLSAAYPILYRGKHGRVAHEFIIDLRPLKAASGVTEADVAKRLQDYGFHSPTMSFPVAGTLMVEPTESESKAELDRFCDALLMIREEIRDIENGKMDKEDNPLKNAPHTADVVSSDNWNRSYSRHLAAYPTEWSRTFKFWPSVSRIDDAYGDKNLVCTCPPLESYVEAEQRVA
ncbi:hypothetical protein GpartN1_g4561.t1 [Galdieria partita]|uniref:Glycine cleavage system P protein n=1 Tax=Galdieria partita TaxID=83374 RepID=A0A9C7PYI8_9RHOD|nr:hypothetical protein GpartN1_g4561.t1 [Galdieria partita]